MIDVGYISDLHFGHENIAKMRGFENIDEYNDEVIRRYNLNVGKRSLIFILGDVTMANKKYIPLLGQLEGRKILVGGNHDNRKDFQLLSQYFESIMGVVEYKGLILSHIPIHASQLSRYQANVHGHLHEELVKKTIYKPLSLTAFEVIDDRYVNVSWDRLKGYPISHKEITKNLNPIIKIRKR